MTRIVRTTAQALILRSLPTQKPETDTGKRLIAGQVALTVGESYDKAWLYLDAPTGDGWAAARLLEDSPVTVAAPTIRKWPRVPNGRDEIVKFFGEPCKDICGSGRVNIPGALALSWAPEQRVTRFACHELMVDIFTSVFGEIHRRGFWDLLEDFGGCYNCREQRGATAKTSTHSWGIGIDINAKQNPLGAAPKMPKQLINIFADHGFTYGGTWKRPDGMHFQYATGY